MRRGLKQRQKYCFPDRLKRQLAQISRHPVTVVEAPSGFGKTTAVREYLKENRPAGACEYWYTCLGESSPMAWLGICDLFSNIEVKVADDLKNLKMPTLDTLFYMKSYLADIRCPEETYLIVDNYQLVNCSIPRELISVFSMHGDPNLHMIFITQPLEAEKLGSAHNNNTYTIGASAFFFDRKDTARLFRMGGLHIADDEMEKVFMSTEGWVAAIRLQIISFMETGSFTSAAGIEQLVENAIWNHLAPQEKDFLLSVSVMDSFTERQAAIMMEQDILSEKIQELLRSNEFIRYLPDKHIYIIHSILHDYLRNRFDYFTDENYKNRTHYKAGYACSANAQYYSASIFFYKVKDLDAIFSLPFSREYLDNQRGQYPSDFIEVLIHECPEDILRKHPFTLLVFGYHTLAHGQIQACKEILRVLALTVQEGKGFHQEELRRINGEYKLLASMLEFNHVGKMHEGQMEAWEILGESSTLVKANTPWVFATTSALNIFWRESGKLEEELLEMDTFSPSYFKLTDGHGSGSTHLMRAEAMLMRGEDDEAEILCHKALYEARGYKQTGICISIELVLARIAILRGDVEGYFRATRELQGYAKENSSLYVLRMIEHSMSIISLVLGVHDYVAPWLYDMENLKEAVYAPVVPFAQVLHLKLLLMEKRYNEFYGVCQCVMDTSGNPAENIKYRMPQVYQLILLAAAKRNKGDHAGAQKYLKEALEAALPDQIYLPFAQQERMEDLLFEMSIRPCGFLSTKDKAFAALSALCRRQQRGVCTIKKAIHQEKSPLTPREREIALLAKERLRAREIADKLYISEMTVKATLRSVYSKLGIHSKIELDLIEF